jgi:hypothetical protein
MRPISLLLAGLLVAGTGCSRSNPSASDANATSPSAPRIGVHVMNHYSVAMEVYVIGSGITHRLGLVSPGIDRDFMLPETLAHTGAVEFMAQPSGAVAPGQNVRTVQVRFSSGDSLEFEIATNLVLSRANIR